MNALVQHVTEQATYLPLGLIAPSPTNPRKRFDQVKLEELAESIKKHGVIQPVLTRRNPAWTETNGQPPYELVCGERRWRGSKLANAPTILALIRDLTDFEALEIQWLENIERHDLHPLEEAEGMRKLLRSGDSLQGYASAEELAAKVGKTKRWVYLRLSLLNLCDAVREAFFDDRLKASVAGLIATLPKEEDQRSFMKRILDGFNGEPLTFRAAAEVLKKDYMLDLARAPFDIVATFKVAGPCGACPKRSGASPDLFEDVTKGDMCQDSACFHEKTREWHELKLADAEAAGHRVLRGPAAEKLMPYAATVLPGGYLWFDEPAPQLTTDKRPLSELFGAKQRGVYTIEHRSGAIVRIVPVDDARKLLKSKGLLRPEPAAPKPQPASATPTAPTPSSSKATDAPPEPPRPRSEAMLAAMRADRACELFGQAAQTLLLERMKSQGLPLAVLKLAIAELADDLSHEALTLVYRAHGWPAETRDIFQSHRDLLLARENFVERVNVLQDGQLLGLLLAQVLMAEELTDAGTVEEPSASNYSGQPTWTLAKALGLDQQIDAMSRETEEEASRQIQAEEDERLGKNAAGDAFAAAQALAKPGHAKYRNRATGETWSGRGLQPKWLKVAIAGGARLEDFAQEAA